MNAVYIILISRQIELNVIDLKVLKCCICYVQVGYNLLK